MTGAAPTRLLVLAVVLGPAACRAHLPAEPAQNAASISIAAAATRTIAGSYERQLRRIPHLSVVGTPGLRFGASGDYSSRTLALSAEGRYWITGAPLIRKHYARQMVGMYTGFRVGLAHTRTSRDGKGAIGSAYELSETATFGYRFILWRRLEMTFSNGLQLRHEFERRAGLPAWTNLGFTTGATIGAVF